MDSTIPARVKFMAETHPDKEVFVFKSSTGLRSALSCQQVYDLSSRVGSLLKKAGIQPGDTVCNTLINSPEAVFCNFGILAAGGVVLNRTGYLADGSDFCHLLNTSRCKLVIADKSQTPCIWEILSKCFDKITRDGVVESKQLPLLQRVIFAPITNGNSEFMDRIQKEESYYYNSGVPSDIATYWMTSGTTGVPKLIARSHSVLLINAGLWSSLINETSDTVVYNSNPMGHAAVSFAYSFLVSCAKRVLIDERFPFPEDRDTFIWELVCSEKCTAAMMPPYVFKGILREPGLLDKHKYLLDVLCASGQPVEKDWADVLGKMARTANFAYGLTEVGYCTSQRCMTSSDVLPFIAGYPVSQDTKVKVVDDNLQEVAPNAHGELVIHADWLFESYLGMEEMSKEKFTPDGWLKTDDMAYKDEKGCLFVMYRRSDAIAIGTSTMYPPFFEHPIRALPEIADVLIVPVPDKDTFNEICACVILREEISLSEKEIASLCDSLFVAESYISPPKYYMVMKSFPVLTSAKPDKRKLISMAKEKFNLN